MIGSLAAFGLALVLIFPFVALVLGFMLWIDLFVCAWSDGDATSAWATDIKITGICAVLFTAAGGWGCWGVVLAIGRVIA